VVVGEDSVEVEDEERGLLGEHPHEVLAKVLGARMPAAAIGHGLTWRVARSNSEIARVLPGGRSPREIGPILVR
jgi:hypothetical protein